MRDTGKARRRPRDGKARSDPWEATKTSLERDLSAAVARGEWAALRAESSTLGGFLEPALLLAFLRDREVDPEVRTPALAELVARAKSGKRVAHTLLYLGLWPALSALRSRKRSRYRGRQEELVADIGSAFLLRVDKIDLSRALQLGATLCRSTARDLASDRGRAPRDDGPVVLVERLPANDQTARAELVELREWILREAGAEADLLVRMLIDGETAKEVAVDLGILPSTVWQRLHRLTGRLRKALLRLGGSDDEAA